MIVGQIKALAAGPLLKKGYGRVGIDGGWVCQNNASRATACVCGGVGGSYHDKAGHPVVGLSRFPNLKKLADEAHALNVKLDFYGNSCNVRPRMYFLPFNDESHYPRALGSVLHKSRRCGGRRVAIRRRMLRRWRAMGWTGSRWMGVHQRTTSLAGWQHSTRCPARESCFSRTVATIMPSGRLQISLPFAALVGFRCTASRLTSRHSSTARCTTSKR
eukprot:SAG31_NODE_1500_length_8090_cov_10.522588_3_plen_217_part_00